MIEIIESKTGTEDRQIDNLPCDVKKFKQGFEYSVKHNETEIAFWYSKDLKMFICIVYGKVKPMVERFITCMDFTGKHKGELILKDFNHFMYCVRYILQIKY